MLQYLRGPTRRRGSPGPMDLVARSLLNGCSVPDLLELLVDCRIPADRLTAHARALHVTRKPIIACLDQLNGRNDHDTPRSPKGP